MRKSKEARKLKLNRETLRDLEVRELREIVGGTETTDCTTAVTCNDNC